MAKRKRRLRMVEDALLPPPERAQHNPLPGGGGPVIERLDGQIPDAKGDIGHPYRAIDTLEKMLRSNTITQTMHQAGRRFEEDFGRAHFDLLRAPDIARIPGQKQGEMPDAIYDARRRVSNALNAMGGVATPAGHIAWHVLGEGVTLRQWAEEMWRPICSRGFSPKDGSALFYQALCALETHYGLA